MDVDRRSRDQDRAVAARRWRDWLLSEMSRAGLRQVDLVQRSNGQLRPAVVSKWVNGEFTASPEYAIAAAEVLGANAIEALRAAGHNAIADAAIGFKTPAGADDPTILTIENSEALTSTQKVRIAEWYRQTVAFARAQAITLVSLIEDQSTD